MTQRPATGAAESSDTAPSGNRGADRAVAGCFSTLDEAVRRVPDGASLALTKFNPMAAVCELVRQRRTGLHLIGVPTASFGVDLLIAAGCASSVETGAFVLGGYGAARNHLRAADEGRLRLIESACPLIEMQLRAGAAGFTFTPVPGLFGSDVLRERGDLKVISDPFDPTHDVVIAPALRPDVALIHGLRADPEGNVVATILNEDRLAVQAARTAIATVEEVREDALQSLAADEQVIPRILLDAVAVVPGGARPFACPGYYGAERDAIKAYLAAARTAEGMAAYVAAIRAAPAGG